MDKLLTLEPGMIIWTFISFAILLWTLKKFAWKPMLEMLDGRELRIRGDLERAEKARAESELLILQHKEMISKTEQQAYAIIDEAKKSAEKVREGIVQTAHEQSRQLVEQAKAEIIREKETALAQLRAEVTDLAILAAGKILKEDLNDDRHKNLVNAFITGLPKN
jgi:F-type H+-transporting ATPase subunit b